MCDVCRHSHCNALCPNVSEPKIIGFCENCGEEIRADYTYTKDNDGNTFCSQDCAVEYYGIEETEWDGG